MLNCFLCYTTFFSIKALIVYIFAFSSWMKISPWLHKKFCPILIVYLMKNGQDFLDTYWFSRDFMPRRGNKSSLSVRIQIMTGRYIQIYCMPKKSWPIFIVPYYIEWDNNSWTDSSMKEIPFFCNPPVYIGWECRFWKFPRVLIKKFDKFESSLFPKLKTKFADSLSCAPRRRSQWGTRLFCFRTLIGWLQFW